jgi:hypothetical protein
MTEKWGPDFLSSFFLISTFLFLPFPNFSLLILFCPFSHLPGLTCPINLQPPFWFRGFWHKFLPGYKFVKLWTQYMQMLVYCTHT